MELEKNPISRKILRRLLKLNDKIFGRPMPEMHRAKQISIYACGPATIEMLFSFVGLKVSQSGVIRSIRAANKIKLFGIDVDDIAKAVKIAGKGKFVFWRKEKSTIKDLDLAVNKYKYPVGVEWQGVFYENEDEDNGHYGVITMVQKTAGYLRIADPYFNKYFKYSGVDRRFKISDFYKKWWDTNDVKIAGTSKTKSVKDVRVMFVITPEDASWPKKLGMKKG